MIKPKIMAGMWRQLVAISIGTMLIMPASATSLSETRISAEIGDVESQYELGVAYADGNGTTQNYRVAFYWLLKAAIAEHGDAEYEVGELYKDGLGVEQSNRLAVDWFTRSAERGNADAQHSLGLMYEDGLGVRTNPERARELYKKACDGGSEAGCNKYKKTSQ